MTFSATTIGTVIVWAKAFARTYARINVYKRYDSVSPYECLRRNKLQGWLMMNKITMAG